MDDTNDRWANDRLSVLAPNQEWQPSLPRGLHLLQAGKRSRARGFTWPVAAVCAAGLLLIAAALGLWKRSGPVELPGSGLVASGARRATPDVLPAQAAKLSALRGKIVLLNFLAAAPCAACDAQAAILQDLERIYGSRGFVVVNLPVGAGKDTGGKLDDVTERPVTLLLDRSGKIAARHVGLCSKSEYESDINAILIEP